MADDEIFDGQQNVNDEGNNAQTTEDNTEPQGKENSENNDNASDNQNNNDGNADIYGSPETFDYSEITLPDGMQLDKEMVSKFDGIAKELNLSNSSANRLMNLAVELTGKNAANISNLAGEMQKAEADSYAQLLNTDKELNAFSESEYSQYLTTANLGIKAVATDGFTQLIKAKGLTNHPDFIKTFHKIGELCANDKLPDVNNPAVSERPADILYGKKD